MSLFDAVLFDWMLTLAHYPSPREHVEAAMAVLGRSIATSEVDRIVEAMAKANELPEVQEAQAIEDTSTAAHCHSEHLLYQAAGIDPDLAGQMYRLLGSPGFHSPYPDTKFVVEQLRAAGLHLGVVSDIHVDLRTHAEQFGFGGVIEAWALSFELGVQKPDPAIFVAALDQLGTQPERTLMVGDRPSRDGAAAELGIPCLILPAPPTLAVRGLEAVVALAVTGQ